MHHYQLVDPSDGNRIVGYFHSWHTLIRYLSSMKKEEREKLGVTGEDRNGHDRDVPINAELWYQNNHGDDWIAKSAPVKLNPKYIDGITEADVLAEIEKEKKAGDRSDSAVGVMYLFVFFPLIIGLICICKKAIFDNDGWSDFLYRIFPDDLAMIASILIILIVSLFLIAATLFGPIIICCCMLRETDPKKIEEKVRKKYSYRENMKRIKTEQESKQGVKAQNKTDGKE